MSDQNVNIEDISIEAFADIYNNEEPKKESNKKGLLDDLEQNVSIEELEEIESEKEKSEENGEENTSIENDIVSTEPEPEQKKEETSLASAMRYMVESGKLFPFDDDKSLDDYTEQDWKDLWDANMNDMANGSVNQVMKEDFENLSPEAQMLIDYERNGGKDSKSMMFAILNAKQTYDLDITTPEGQRDVVRAYYTKKRIFKDASSLERELDRIEDAGDMKEKAEEFKPMLQEIQNNEIERQMAEQERNKQILQKQLQAYNDSIYKTLDTDNLNGIHITKKIKNMLYQGLTSNNYQTMKGTRTNLLYHLIEENQYRNPNHSLIAEVTWLLADPQGYKQAVADTIAQQLTRETANKLKNEQQGRSANVLPQQERRTVKRPIRNIFER